MVHLPRFPVFRVGFVFIFRIGFVFSLRLGFVLSLRLVKPPPGEFFIGLTVFCFGGLFKFVFSFEVGVTSPG